MDFVRNTDVESYGAQRTLHDGSGHGQAGNKYALSGGDIHDEAVLLEIVCCCIVEV